MATQKQKAMATQKQWSRAIEESKEKGVFQQCPLCVLVRYKSCDPFCIFYKYAQMDCYDAVERDLDIIDVRFNGKKGLKTITRHANKFLLPFVRSLLEDDPFFTEEEEEK